MTRIRIAVGLALLLGGGGPLTGQTTPALPAFEKAAAAGRFLPLKGDVRDWCEILSPREEQDLLSVLSRLEQMVRDLPVLHPPHGVDVRTHRTLTSEDETCERAPAWAELTVDFFQPSVEGAADRPAGSITFFINPEPDAVAGMVPRYEEAQGPIYREPGPVGSIGGVPATGEFRIGRRDAVTVLVSDGARPYWIPVSRERWRRRVIPHLELMMAGAREDLAREEQAKDRVLTPQERKKLIEEIAAGLRASDTIAWRRFLAETARIEQESPEIARSAKAVMLAWARQFLEIYERRLAAAHASVEALTPADRASDAWYAGAGSTDEKSPGASRLMSPNPGFYEKSRRTEVQAIAVQSRTSRYPYVLALQAEVMRTLPWQEITGLLGRIR